MSQRKQRIAAEQKLYNAQHGKIQKPDVYGTRKRLLRLNHQRNDTSDDEEFEALDIPVDSDSVSAADFLIKSNPKSNIPLCYIHQIYSILPNNTIVDRELQQAIKKGIWRKFHVLGALEDEYVLMRTSDYCHSIDQARAECIKEQNGDPKVFDLFKDIVLDADYNDVSVSKDTLLSKIKLSEKNLTQLVSYGLLLPHIQVGLYWFTARKQGSFVSNISAGRLEILRILKKRSTKDIMEKMLRQKKLHKTSFNFEFLMHDLLGSGRVEKYLTAMGNLIRLTNKGERSI